MKTKKKNKLVKVCKVGSNVYSILKIGDELFIKDDNYYIEKKGLFKTKINQGTTLLELSAPLTFLLSKIIELDVENEDKEFPDMTTYATLDNKEIRKTLKDMYSDVLENEITELRQDFNAWKIKFEDENSAILPKEQIEKILKSNENALNCKIEDIKNYHKFADPSFNLPRITDSKDLYNLTELNRFDFLATQKFGESFKISYFYDLDQFGTINIYKVKTVRGVVKSIETLIYNRDIITKVMNTIEDKNL